MERLRKEVRCGNMAAEENKSMARSWKRCPGSMRTTILDPELAVANPMVMFCSLSVIVERAGSWIGPGWAGKAEKWKDGGHEDEGNQGAGYKLCGQFI